MKSTDHTNEWSTAMKLNYVKGKLSLIPAFGDSIGKEVNKAELGLCVAMLASAEAAHADLLAALEESLSVIRLMGCDMSSFSSSCAALARAKGGQP